MKITIILARQTSKKKYFPSKKTLKNKKDYG